MILMIKKIYSYIKTLWFVHFNAKKYIFWQHFWTILPCGRLIYLQIPLNAHVIFFF